jgi:putative addiction module component (TIGR02574 family)
MHMNERVKKLSEEIRKLSPDEQADLMDELLVLTHREPDPEIDKALIEEVERRIDAYDRGETKGIAIEDAMAHLRAKYPRKP